MRLVREVGLCIACIVELPPFLQGKHTALGMVRKFTVLCTIKGSKNMSGHCILLC